MNPGILTSEYAPPPMPYGLLGRVSPVAVPYGMASMDADAMAYLAAVESADGRPLETAVRNAVNQFVLGCKADGIWSAIRASCLLMGARTLSGALTPLVGPRPTSVNFVSGDYNRRTGLVGNGTTKHLDSGRAVTADPQNSAHIAVYKADATSGSNPYFIGAVDSSSSNTALGQDGIYIRSGDSPTNIGAGLTSSALGLHGVSRSSASAYTIKRPGAALVSGTRTSSAITTTRNHFVFAISNLSGTAIVYSASRMALYSIGSDINLTLLDARASALAAAIAAAIP